MKIAFDSDKKDLTIILSPRGKFVIGSYYLKLYFSSEGNLCKIIIKEPEKILEPLKNFNLNQYEKILKEMKLEGSIKELRDSMIKEINAIKRREKK